MQRNPVPSSDVKSVGYADGTLEVEFQTGAVYRYLKVPQEVYDSLCRAPSVGRFLAAYVKPVYRWEKVDTPPG